MAPTIELRDVPDEVHRELEARAARAGMTLSVYLVRELERLVSIPPQDLVLARLEAIGRVEVGESASAAVRAGRAERDEELGHQGGPAST